MLHALTAFHHKEHKGHQEHKEITNNLVVFFLVSSVSLMFFVPKTVGSAYSP